VAESPGDERDPLEELAADYAERLRRGEHPSIADYQLAHPGLATEISDFFPTVAALEELRGPGIPKQLGEYHLGRELGRGGMGVVFEAEQPSLRRKVAVKVMTRSDSRARARFQREGRIAAGLAHPGILPVFACGEQDGTAWIAMHLVEGVGLDRVMTELAAGRVPPPGRGLVAVVQALRAATPLAAGTLDREHYREVARLGAQAAEALDHAHRSGVLHRDVKPANLLLGGDGRLWVADFGLAKADGDETVTGTRLVAGTLRYTAPERFSGKCDARSDVYALGVTLFELLTLRPAFTTAGPGPTMSAILSGGVPDPGPLVPAAPPELIRAIRRACARDPGARQPDAATLAAELRAVGEAQLVPQSASPTPSRLHEPVSWLPWLVAAAGISLLLIAAAWLLLRPLPPPVDRPDPRQGPPPWERDHRPPPPGPLGRPPEGRDGPAP
jgi:serine/threonine protein kinase